MSSGNDRRQVAQGLALVSVVWQIGCVTVVVVIGALAAGLGLDQIFDTRPLFTMLLVLASIPLSLYLLVQIALSAVKQLTPPPPSQAAEDLSPEDE